MLNASHAKYALHVIDATPAMVDAKPVKAVLDARLVIPVKNATSPATPVTPVKPAMSVNHV